MYIYKHQLKSKHYRNSISMNGAPKFVCVQIQRYKRSVSLVVPSPSFKPNTLPHVLNDSIDRN